MFGLEKQERKIFEFDLEKELKSDPERKKTLIKEVETMIQEIKSQLRTGTEVGDFDEYGVLLHGYSALLKVLNKISQKK